MTCCSGSRKRSFLDLEVSCSFVSEAAVLTIRSGFQPVDSFLRKQMVTFYFYPWESRLQPAFGRFADCQDAPQKGQINLAYIPGDVEIVRLFLRSVNIYKIWYRMCLSWKGSIIILLFFVDIGGPRWFITVFRIRIRVAFGCRWDSGSDLPPPTQKSRRLCFSKSWMFFLEGLRGKRVFLEKF